MTVTLYEMSIPVFIRAMENVSDFLQKAHDHARQQNINPQTLLQARLIDDMHDLAFQIRCISDTSKGFVVRIGALEPVVMDDNETTFEELRERMQKTVDLLKTVRQSAVDERQDAFASIHTRRGELRYTAKDYFTLYALPNFYFHVGAAYAILRKEGVPLGKWDFLGEPRAQDVYGKTT